jgi:hypothetical protein
MKYYTTENKLTDDGSYTARVVVNKAYTEDEVIDKLLRKRNIVSKPDLRGVMSALKDTFVDIIREGNGLNLSWLKLSFSMKGSFPTANAQRDPERNPLEINLNPGALLTEVIDEVELERVSKPNFGPFIEEFFDATSRTRNSRITPSEQFEITGERLRIDGRNPDEIGLYLRAEDGTEIKVEKLLRNDPGYISGRMPDVLESGSYKLVVKTQVGVGYANFLSEVRVGISEFSLTVS